MKYQRVWKAVLPSAVVVGLTLTGVAAVVAVKANASDGKAAASGPVSAASAAQTEDYWTPARMAAATPLGRALPSATKGKLRTRSAGSAASRYAGSPAVGALFFSNGSGNHYCTASAIDGGKRNLVITAAHCIYGRGKYASNIAYVPKYDAGNRPYGLWTAKRMWVTSGWRSRRDQDMDFGFIALNPRGGRQIGQVTGVNILTVNQVRRWVNVPGYPMVHYARSDHPIICANYTKQKFRYQLEFDCAGYYGGTSGSPFLWQFNRATGTGRVIGVIGGYQEGGNVDYISYSSYFDQDVWNLRAYAVSQA